MAGSPPTPPPDSYQVGISLAQKKSLLEGAVWATQNDLREAYGQALREIEFRLKFEAHEWGESREFLSELGLQMRCGTSRMITVLFGVDRARLLVHVKQFRINKRYRG